MNHIYIKRHKILPIERLEYSLEFNLKAFFEEIIPNENVIFLKVYIVFHDFEDKNLKRYFYIKENINKISPTACRIKILGRLRKFYTWINKDKIRTFTLLIVYTT